MVGGAEEFVFVWIDFHFPYAFEGPVRYPTLRQWKERNESLFVHSAGMVEGAVVAPWQLSGFEVRVGEGESVRDVPFVEEARVEVA